jgi:hypothetical protein
LRPGSRPTGCNLTHLAAIAIEDVYTGIPHMTALFEPLPDDSGGFPGLGKPSRRFGLSRSFPSHSVRSHVAAAIGGAHLRDQPQDVSEHMPRNGNLGHLEGDVAAVAYDLSADLDQYASSLCVHLANAGLAKTLHPNLRKEWHPNYFPVLPS